MAVEFPYTLRQPATVAQLPGKAQRLAAVNCQCAKDKVCGVVRLLRVLSRC